MNEGTGVSGTPTLVIREVSPDPGCAGRIFAVPVCVLALLGTVQAG